MTPFAFALALRRNPARLVVATVTAIAASAWIAVFALHDRLHAGAVSGYLSALPEQLRNAASFCGTPPGSDGPGLAKWMAGWALMTVAMMLPPAIPLLRAFKRLTSGRSDDRRLTAVTTGAFLAVWIGAGLALYAGGSILNGLIGNVPALAERPWLLAGIAAVLAGAYQFSPLKMACLDACRSPLSVIMTRWNSAQPARASAKIGLAYGAICVGCCWALMLLTVVTGALALPIMAVAAIFMMLERLLPSVRPLIPVQAGFAIIVGLLLLAGTIPPGFQIG